MNELITVRHSFSKSGKCKEKEREREREREGEGRREMPKMSIRLTAFTRIILTHNFVKRIVKYICIDKYEF